MNDKLPTYAKQPTTIRPRIPEVVVLIDEDKAAEISAALEVTKSITRVGSDNFEEANRATKAIARLASGLEKSRKEIKAPFLEAGRAIDDAAREHAATLDAAKRRLADLVGAHLEEEERKRREEERRQREAIEAAARQAAEAERLAREEEERRQREIEAAKRREEEAARKAAAEADAAKRAELEAQARREAEAAAELEAKAREDQDAMEDILEEAAVVELPEVREKKKSAVSFREVEEVVVVDLSKVPAQVNGIQILELKVANAKKLLSAGVDVPGLRLVKTRKAIARAR
jgi:hypothetical protein